MQGFALEAGVHVEKEGATAVGVHIGVGTSSDKTPLPCKPIVSVAYTGRTVGTPEAVDFLSGPGLIGANCCWGCDDPLGLGPITSTAPLQQHLAGGELRVRVCMTEVDGMQL